MASPDVFLSSPSSRANRLGAHVAISSSPELPSLQDILSQRPKRPQLRSGSKAVPIPDNATTTFTSASSLWRSLQADEPVKAASAARGAVQEALEDIDALAVIEVPPENVPKPRKPRRRKKPVPARAEVTTETPVHSNSPVTDQPWRKYKSPIKEKDNSVVEPMPPKTRSSVPESAPGDEVETVTSHFFKQPEPKKSTEAKRTKEDINELPEPKKSTKAKATKDDANEPLQLEPAMSRRMDWTPPAQKAHVIVDSDPPGVEEPRRSQADDELAEPFGTLLAAYKCQESVQEPIPISDEDSSFLKKRKLIELDQSKSADASEPSKPEKSPIKQKAPKKKPRTITGLATAAYRLPTQPDPDLVAVNENQETDASKSTLTDKGKAKPRKRASRAPKKPPPPPKPILLSPGAALRQVARQDFVFGTSSQLAREQSPSLLRDLPAGTRNSNQLDYIDFVTPINSDAIEPPERRPTLWGAAARDADGDLFDLEVRNFADGSQRLPEPAAEADPFGYVRVEEDPVALPDLPANGNPRDDDSFVNLSDILPAPDRKPVEIVDDESRFPGSELSTSTTTGRRGASGEGRDKGLQRGREDGKRAEDGSECPPVSKEPPVRPSYELCSDAQLAQQVAQYGFKPIRKRTAMIALLEQCWPGGAGAGLGSVRSASTVAGASKGASKSKSTTTPAAETAKEKRPRGRPKKLSEGVAQEPPPSAQAPESPKRPRGRPRKDAAASPPRAPTATQAKASATTTSQPPATPKRKAKSKAVIEIPDSESDVAGDLSASPCSSPDPTFSPAQPVDLTLSLDEDTELSLTMSPTDQQSALFVHITKAVTTAPRTTDPANPSWHEKILLYDPVVLEDLTSWLNCGQLTRVGYDGEASVGEVKKWCESKSVCCLWKVNLRGKERKRY
ncbi:Structure-specific endonuclease subunit SLX4 [Tolypocladium ophioglossoides CBS 100239]|uniref:Structure-specific endonuclease subunit SLX4 n=1 Tax=Tolypocladium ophioglossoides (strain CBS 100239) TaxID=1163406 RepID=A0A0L0NA63_TOLOC|nr:Structure-specific endonuclease subunit SLX4 [Tolypocladium ophioglossoides CBS 100239]